ncbi:hypothetical protein K501DRAFT_267680 [Backusella circina FSU 941]|nr:hypothetical protein K501DRAFT_267680 [Backusella circina FSU 941]
MDVVILGLRNLFRPFNYIFSHIIEGPFINSIPRVEIEEDGTKRHKWDDDMNLTDGRVSVMLIEFAGDFVNIDPKKLHNDTFKVYRSAAGPLNYKNSNRNHPPCIYVVNSLQFKIYYESFTLASNRVYVRARNTVMSISYSPNGLKIALEELLSVFS